MKRERPPMPPLAVRVEVIKRMLIEAGRFQLPMLLDWAAQSKTRSIELGLKWLGFEHPHLDHDPALILRDYDATVSDVAARYTPHAHDPNHLVYREKADHQRKTTGRRPGAERTITTKGSDIGLKTKFARLERPAKCKAKIAGRPFPKCRGFRKP